MPRRYSKTKYERTDIPSLYHTPATRNFPNGAWELRYYDSHGGNRRKRFHTREGALDFKAKLRVDKREGRFINPTRQNTLFKDVAEDWYGSRERDTKPKTISGYGQILNRVEEHFGKKRVGFITPDDVNDWVQELIDDGKAPGTIRNSYRVLKMVMDFAVRHQYIAANPCVGITLPRNQPREMLFLTAEQVNQLAEEVGEPNGLIVKFAAFTGLRAGEIAGLRMKDLSKNSLRVRQSIAEVNGELIEGEPKTKAAKRTVGIPAFVLAELKDYIGDRANDPEAFVFVGSRLGGMWRHSNWYARVFRPAVASLVEEGTWPKELAGLRFHDLRHTYASYLVAIGAHPKQMAEVMGHSSVQITLDRYAHLFPHMLDALTKRLDEEYRPA
jgi:integrase